jgi:Bacterial Ig-like domain
MAGNTTSAVLASVTYTFNLDTTLPAAPSVALATDSGTSATDKITKTSTLNVTGLEAGATWEYTLNGTTWQAGTGTTITGITGDGTKSVQVRETDTAGNTSAASTAYTFTLDTTAPTMGITGPSSIRAGESATLTYTLSEANGGSFVQSDITPSSNVKLSSWTETSATSYTTVVTADPLVSTDIRVGWTLAAHDATDGATTMFVRKGAGWAGSPESTSAVMSNLIIGETYTINWESGVYALAGSGGLFTTARVNVYSSSGATLATQDQTTQSVSGASTWAGVTQTTFVADRSTATLALWNINDTGGYDVLFHNVTVSGHVHVSASLAAGAYTDIAGNAGGTASWVL